MLGERYEQSAMETEERRQLLGLKWGGGVGQFWKTSNKEPSLGWMNRNYLDNKEEMTIITGTTYVKE